mgnify:CR=1 FL=1
MIDLDSQVKQEDGLKVKFQGVDYSINKPVVGDLEWFEKNKDGGIKAMIDFIERIGVPQDRVREMSPEQLKMLTDGLLEKFQGKK